MSRQFKLFLVGIANSFRVDSYYNIVTPTKDYGEIIKRTNYKRKKSIRRINRIVDEKIKEISN